MPGCPRCQSEVIGSAKTVLLLVSPRSRAHSAATSLPARRHAVSPAPRRSTPPCGPCVGCPCLASRSSSGSPRRACLPGSGTWPKTLKPEPPGSIIILQRDAMGHDLRKKRCKLWIWKARDGDRGRCSTGNGGDGTRRRCRRGSIVWHEGTSSSIARINGRPLPQSFRRTSGATTHDMERHHCR
jgi:hypothetical protein